MYPQAHKLGLPRLVEPRTHRGASGLLESTLRARVGVGGVQLSPGLDVHDVKLDVKLDATLDAPRRILDALGDADLWLAPPNLSAPNAYREYLSSTCGLNAAGNWRPEDTMKCWRHKTCPPEVLSRILSTPAAAFSSCSAQLRAHGCLAMPEQARCGDAPVPQHSHTQRPPLTCHPNNAVGERG